MRVVGLCAMKSLEAWLHKYTGKRLVWKKIKKIEIRPVKARFSKKILFEFSGTDPKKYIVKVKTWTDNKLLKPDKWIADN